MLCVIKIEINLCYYYKFTSYLSIILRLCISNFLYKYKTVIIGKWKLRFIRIYSIIQNKQIHFVRKTVAKHKLYCYSVLL